MQFAKVARVPPVNHAQDARATIKLHQYHSCPSLPFAEQRRASGTSNAPDQEGSLSGDLRPDRGESPFAFVYDGAFKAETLSVTRPRMRVLYMSGYTDDAIVHHGVLDGLAALLEKP